MTIRSIPTSTRRRAFLAAGALAAGAAALAACGSSNSAPPAAAAKGDGATTTAAGAQGAAVKATVFSPEPGSIQGKAGVGMIVDLKFTATDPAALPGQFRLGGSLPAPAAPVKPGHLEAFPGLVVTLATTGEAAGGPTTNLANLFQIVTTSKQADGSTQMWATWTNAAPGFGIDVDTTLTSYLVQGTAPDKVPAGDTGLTLVSNKISVPFRLAGATH